MQTISLFRNVTRVAIQTMAALSLVALFIGLAVSPASAASAEWIAHRAIKMKLLKEASDRSDVEFLTTHVDRVRGPIRHVTGTGRFRRHGKSPQKFTYHTDVNIEDNSDKITGYDITS
jgi:hypothetical protein